jgi:hypothetical protein
MRQPLTMREAERDRETNIPAIGPTKVAAANNAIAIPQSTLLRISARAPPMMARGATPKKPLKNLHIMIVSMFCATATGIWKIANILNAKKSGGIRPYNFGSGPQIIGAIPNPKANRDVPSVATSVPTPNSTETGLVPVLKTLDANVTTQVIRARISV